jgi:hypothetical protein
MEFVRTVDIQTNCRTRYLSDMYLRHYLYTILLGDVVRHAFTMTVHAYEHCPVGKE